MNQPLCSLEFGVRNLEDIRLLVTTWNALLIHVFDDTSFDVEDYTRPVSSWEYVRVVVEDRVPGQEVLLSFVGPHDVLDRFLDALEAKGQEFARRDIVPGMMFKCWFPPPPSKPEAE